MSEVVQNTEYDSEPVKYCARCYSLKVKYEEALDCECCGECGSMEIQEAPIEEWEELYTKRYGHKFVTKNDDPKNSHIFKLPLDKIKSMVCSSPKWNEIIHSLYPKFPGGYGKVDSILLFFDKVLNQNRLDELRIQLLKYFKNKNYGRAEEKQGD